MDFDCVMMLSRDGGPVCTLGVKVSVELDHSGDSTTRDESVVHARVFADCRLTNWRHCRMSKVRERISEEDLVTKSSNVEKCKAQLRK